MIVVEVVEVGLALRPLHELAYWHWGITSYTL